MGETLFILRLSERFMSTSMKYIDSYICFGNPSTKLSLSRCGPRQLWIEGQLKWKACPVHRWLPGTQIQALLRTLLDYNPFVHLATLWTCCFSMLKPADPKDHRLPSFFIIIDFEERGENRETVKESKKEKHWFVVSLIDEFIAWFLYVTWSGTEPATLVFQEGRLSKRLPSQGRLPSFLLQSGHPPDSWYSEHCGGSLHSKGTCISKTINSTFSPLSDLSFLYWPHSHSFWGAYFYLFVSLPPPPLWMKIIQ